MRKRIQLPVLSSLIPPEERLLLSVLIQAIRDYISGDEKERYDAETWFFSREYNATSFDFICDYFRFEKEAIIRQIKKLAISSREGYNEKKRLLV